MSQTPHGPNHIERACFPAGSAALLAMRNPQMGLGSRARFHGMPFQPPYEESCEINFGRENATMRPNLRSAATEREAGAPFLNGVFGGTPFLNGIPVPQGFTAMPEPFETRGGPCSSSRG